MEQRGGPDPAVPRDVLRRVVRSAASAHAGTSDLTAAQARSPKDAAFNMKEVDRAVPGIVEAASAIASGATRPSQNDLLKRINEVLYTAQKLDNVSSRPVGLPAQNKDVAVTQKALEATQAAHENEIIAGNDAPRDLYRGADREQHGSNRLAQPRTVPALDRGVLGRADREPLPAQDLVLRRRGEPFGDDGTQVPLLIVPRHVDPTQEIDRCRAAPGAQARDVGRTPGRIGPGREIAVEFVHPRRRTRCLTE